MNARQLLWSCVALVVVFPMLTLAAGLVPCGGVDANGSPEPSCQACHVATLVNDVTTWLVGILGVAAAVLFVIAGYRLVTGGGNPSVLNEAKGMILNTLIGFVIVLSAWLLIDLVMKALISDGVTAIGPWNAIQCVEQPVYSLIPDLEVSQGRSIGLAGGATLAEECAEVFPGGPRVDCTAITTACSAGGGTPDIDDTTDPNVFSVTCTYSATGYAGSCEQIADTSNPCHASNLSIFGSRAEEASVICNKESGGQPVRSGSDLCCGPGGNCSGAPSFSGGYFQINILAHADKIPGCDPGAFYDRNGTAGPQGDCVRRNSEGICTGWSCSITDRDMYNNCMQVTTNSALNFEIAEELYAGRGNRFNDWSWSARRCNIPF